MSDVEIVEARREALDPQLFWGAGLDLPRPGQRQEPYAVVVAGWVSPRDVATVQVECLCEERAVARWRADLVREDVRAHFDGQPSAACGFVGTVRTLDLPARFELRLEAVHAGGRARLATIVGRRSALCGDDDGGLQPLFVTALGRTGSTALMHQLAHHPSLLVAPPFPYEVRVASYWTHVVEALSRPDSHLQALASLDDRPYWWAGASKLAAEAYLDRDAPSRWLGGRALDRLGAFAREQTRDFYGVASRSREAPSAVAPSWFAEKRGPDPLMRRLQAELFPRCRELFLVRDPRDTFVSVLAFNRKRGEVGFWRERVASDEEYAVLLAEHLDNLLASRREAGEKALLVRYEDLVLDPGATLARILRWADLDGDPSLVSRLLEEAAAAGPEAQRYHRTSADASASVGRWRRELADGLRATCERAFAGTLQALGYEP
jgi:hypothetical protein